MKTSIEKHTRLTLRSIDGKIYKLVIRGNHEPHATCSAGHNSDIGDVVFYHSDIDYTYPKIIGEVIKKEVVGWDWSKPIGQREVTL